MATRSDAVSRTLNVWRECYTGATLVDLVFLLSRPSQLRKYTVPELCRDIYGDNGDEAECMQGRRKKAGAAKHEAPLAWPSRKMLCL